MEKRKSDFPSGYDMLMKLGYVLYDDEKIWSFRKINNDNMFVEVIIRKSDGQMLGFVEGKQCEFSPKVLEATFTFIRDMGFII